MEIKEIQISLIKPAAYNPRKDLKPGDPAYDRLKKALETFDLVEPLVWNQRTGNLVGGHQRFKILLERGDTNVPVTGHGTQKPVECMRRPILNHTNPGQTVYDPFLGSGTTVIAAESTGRFAYGLEIDPGYCDVIVKRWQEFTSKKATLEATGQPFGGCA